MRSSALITSAIAAGALALPQGQLEKRQVTVIDTVTVTTTVPGNPFTVPAWKGPPKFSQTPRPTFFPPAWTPPRPGQGLPTVAPNPNPVFTPSPRPSVPVRSSSSRVIPSNAVPTRASSSPGLPLPSSEVPAGGVTSIPVLVPTSSASASPTSIRSSNGGAVDNPTQIPTSQIASSVIPTPTSGAAPLDPGHTPGPAQASLTPADGAAYIDAILFHHNAARANHNAAPLVWNTSVAATAAITAQTCNFAHYIPDGVRQGQNLFTTSGSVFNVTAGITESWYKGEFQAMLPHFGEASLSDDVFHNVGHLTQVLWKGTTSVGCNSVDCGSNMKVGGQPSNLNKYTVCNYWPAGNVATQYAINVGSPISTTNLGSWSD
ncbi:hypothetical protein E8E13_004255 [Curvularia kusanoi]|uniref:SCP domain-containing protein n=1 Tax=Curvularia kusanoi TaxID=90978 RepID=A0A9P4TFK3_CURKU|nr:hypothetical protein E8E13_004255 [Curvularia kusanoi]